MKNYNPYELVMIDSKIRELATKHYRYGKSMPLCFGKARGISGVLKACYDTEVSIEYVWNVLNEFKKESEIAGDKPF